MTTNYLRDYGPRLITNGYKIIPIKRGCKAPLGVRGWTEIVADLNQLGIWASAGFEGVGILCKDNPAVDIDVLDREVSSRMESIVKGMFPDALSRVGKFPKTLLPFRTETPFKKVRSATYEDMFGDRHAVEILGDGQQYVAYAEHPDTLRPYEWTTVGISEFLSDDLPTITHGDATTIVKRFEEIAETTDGWVKVADGTSGSETASYADDGDTAGDSVLADFSNLRPRLNISNEEVLRDLATLSADEYERWVQVGMALYHQYNGTQEGLEIWLQWSRTSDNFTDERSCRTRWRGFAPRGNSRQITFASVRRWARDGRMEDDPLGEFNDRYVYVANGDYVHDLGALPHDAPFEMKEFRNWTAHNRVTVEVPAPTAQLPDRTVEKIVPVHKLWIVDPEHKKARAFNYKPGKPKILRDANGEEFINTFHMPQFVNPCPETPGTKSGLSVPSVNADCEANLLGVFFRHMEYIIPVEAERNWFYNWMAYNIQYPGLRCKVTPLLIATDHGTGRGWISQVMSNLLGSWNCTKTKMSVLNGESSAGVYQDFMNDSLLCCIEEVHDSDKPYGVEAKIRDYLTENVLEINVKYGAKTTKEVYTNFMFQSNHTDALVLKPEDRRINVFLTVDAPKGADYYERLYQWLAVEDGAGSATPGVGQVAPDGSSIHDRVNNDGGGNPDRDRGENPGDIQGVDQEDLDVEEEMFDRAGARVSPGVACLWHWLSRRDLTGFNHTTSIKNKARADLIQNSQTDVEEIFMELIRNPPFEVMSLQEICTLIENEKCSNSGIMELLSDSERRQIKKIVQQRMKRFDAQIKVSKRQVLDKETGEWKTEKREKVIKIRPWAFDKKQDFTVSELREMYEKRKL